MQAIITNPREIEKQSMAIIENHLPELQKLPFGHKEVIMRVIHTTGDLTFGEIVFIHPRAVESGLAALKAGRPIVTDINMVKTGINKQRLQELGITVNCYISEPKVIEESKKTGLTRAMIAMQFAAQKAKQGIIVIGNAPTALFTLCDLIKSGKADPALIIGTPVGFVGAKESKELLMQMEVPYITVPGTKGGSTIAAAIVNALLYLS
ncbi:precorrin-8X methylmutase [Desulfolucanica intricata]|uniref:precorrin-8X methylmutase n=1 Tax=Desulfolucanica intricata TaxID=1285191 RepID=UPI000A67E130|nr:precorrin-8X methylmutase [Desulfolucanica intricata]